MTIKKRSVEVNRFVVIGFDVRDHIVVGKIFEDIEEANKYLEYLYTEMIGKIIGKEHYFLEYAEIFEMDYVPSSNS